MNSPNRQKNSCKKTKIRISLFGRSNPVFVSVVYMYLIIIGLRVSVIPVIVLVSSIILHEIGHYIFFKHYGIQVSELCITPISGYTMTGDHSYKNRKNYEKAMLFATIAGPIFGATLVIPIIFLRPYISKEVMYYSYIMLLPSALQLIPINKDTDGYKIIKSFLIIVRS